MKQKDPLGQFEQLVITAVLALGKNAYPVPITAAIGKLGKREVSPGSVYITLDRLEDKGYLASRLADPTSVRGGRPKRYYRVLAAGERALREAFETSQALQQTAEPAWRFVKWPTKPLLEDSD